MTESVLSARRRIYVASSWRCAAQPEVVGDLRHAGHKVYDFRNPRPGNHGFAWSEIDPDWLAWEPEPFRDALGHPVAVDGFLIGPERKRGSFPSTEETERESGRAAAALTAGRDTSCKSPLSEGEGAGAGGVSDPLRSRLDFGERG